MPSKSPASADAPLSRSRWAGVPAQERAAERRAQLIDAGFDLLGTEGDAGTTVRAVCQRARLNPRYFYESFSDRDELLVAVYDHVVAEHGGGDDPRRAKVLYNEALGNAALNRRRIEAGHDLSAFLQEDARRRRRAAPEGDAMGALSSVMLVGGISEVLTAWVEGRIDVSREQLVDDLAALTIGLIDSAAAAVGRRRDRGTSTGRGQSRAPATKSSPKRSSS